MSDPRDRPADHGLRTITELEAARYDWIAAECCRGTVMVPFKLIRPRHPRWNLAAMTLDQVGEKLRCEHCGGRPARYYPSRQEHAPGFARSR